MSYKVLVADPISVEGLKSLNDDADFEVIHQTGLSEAELIDTIQDYDALIVRSQTTVTADILKARPKIKSCCSRGCRCRQYRYGNCDKRRYYRH